MDAIDISRLEIQGQIEQGRHDAQIGELPQFRDEFYLSGYLTEIRKMPIDVHRRLIWPEEVPSRFSSDEEF